ncbi:MAG: VCBS repeat-containing protein [Proteobacteria bacterium]|nr:VCBS repeat-containing protein [Pseudomonadota bacterium]MCP4918728.1 VCBS repeat-containing protein [Pseudomonadota bacterium]
MLLLLLACSDYELAQSADVSAGDSCPSLDRDPYAVTVDDTCIAEPTVGTFDPVIEWQWDSNPLAPGYDDIMSTAAIGNLTDDDGDGDIDDDDIPDIVFATFSGGAYTSPGAITAISGDGTVTLFSSLTIDGHGIYGSSGIAIGDLEGDGIPEVCGAGTAASVVCYSVRDGRAELKWAAGTDLYYVGCPSLADMDGDGLSEVIMGRSVYDFQGNLVGTGEYGVGRYMTFAVDMDADGQLEVVSGNAVYEADGTALWTDGGTDGIPAVADFDLDGRPEHVRAGGGAVTVQSLDGSFYWETTIPGGGTGGPPTVADFDGDGLPEVGVAALSYYTVFDTDGAILWSNPVSDYSSSVTGSAVFDFEADGDAEVVYADEHTLWIFEGATGAVLMAQEGHASGTLFEYPLVADVDNDGSTEIIVTSNDYAYAGWNGVTVIGDANASWAPARPIWNQFAYHISNVENDGGVPQVQTENWLTWNSFRAGGTELGPSNWLPDLAVGGIDLCDVECDRDEVVVSFAIENRGLLPVEEHRVEVGEGREVLDIGSGDAVYTQEYRRTKDEWGESLTVSVEALSNECGLSDNSRSFTWPCD